MSKRLKINDRIGDYRITGYLGEGGMGVVYRGVHEKIGRETAIKVLASGSADPTFRTRFLNEARVHAGLHHPNIATLYDFRESQDELLIFMELVDGESLENLIARRVFTIDEALTVFLSVCEAVAYLHENGTIHRDIKSQNVKLTSSGVVKVLDFGIAKDAASHTLTQTGGVIGTPNYLSPGQLHGKPASARSDIWALGVLLYEMLTGQLPFRAETLGELVVKIADARYAPPDKLNPAVPRRAVSVITKCLRKDPAARYQSVRDLISDVRTTLDERRGKVVPSDLQTAVIRAGEHSAIPAAAVTTSPSEIFPTGLTPRTRARLLLASIVGGGAFLLVLVVLGLYLLLGPGETVAHTEGSSPVKIDVFEGKATVIRDGRVIGSTPYSLNVGPDETVTLTLRREGFEDKEINVTSGEGAVTYEMDPEE